MKNSFRKSGFTLAEILLTLMIIGIVAAMTIPGLINSTADAEYKAAFKKAYEVLNQAGQKMAADNGGSIDHLFKDYNSTRDEFGKYLNYTKTCNSGTAWGKCWHQVKFLNGDIDSDAKTHWSQAVTADGMAIVFDFRNGSGGTGYYSDRSDTCNLQIPGMPDNVCDTIVVDVNGDKLPNTWGKDVYSFTVLKNGTIFPAAYHADNVTFNPPVEQIPEDCNPSNPDAQGLSCGYLYIQH